MNIIDVNSIEELAEIVDSVDEEYTLMAEQILIPFDKENKDYVVLYDPIYRVPVNGTTYLVGYGVFCGYDENTKTAEPDWDISMIFADNGESEFDGEKPYLHYEQGTPQTALKNYTNAFVGE